MSGGSGSGDETGSSEGPTGDEGSGGGTDEPSSDDDYETLASVENGGTIAGTITYAGDATASVEGVTQDEEVCVHGGQPALDLVVNDGNLANVVVYLSDIRSGLAAEPERVEIDNVECRFEPRVQIAHRGAMLAARNSDGVLHNTHLFLRQGHRSIANIALPRVGQVVERRLRRSGMVEVKCDAHDWMQGWIFVSDHPYARVTGEDGTFTMGDIPSGEYTVTIWHERLGEMERTVTVEAGETATLDLAMTGAD